MANKGATSKASNIMINIMMFHLDFYALKSTVLKIT